jgi:hypothetical protein
LFVSYRRADGTEAALLLERDLRDHLSSLDVFVDRQIRGGRAWAEEIFERIAGADAVLALIGQHWASEEGLHRLADTEDMVRRELEKAIELDKPIIPVPIHGAHIPSARDLPASLRPAVARQHVTIHDDQRDLSITRLAEAVGEVLRRARGSSEHARDRERATAPGSAAAEDSNTDLGANYLLARRALSNGGTLDLTVSELLDTFGRKHLTSAARDDLETALADVRVRSQPKVSRLVIGDRVRLTCDGEVPELQLRARVQAEGGTVTIHVGDLLRLFGERRFNDKTSSRIEKYLGYVGLVSDPRVTRADKDGIVVVALR